MTAAYQQGNLYGRVIEVLLIITLTTLFFCVPNGADVWVIWPCLIIFYVYFFNAVRTPLCIYSGIKTFLKIDVLLMLFYYLLFYLPYQSYVLGLSDIRQNDFLENTYLDYTNSSLIACTIGLVAFMIGFRPAVPNNTPGAKLADKARIIYTWAQSYSFYVIIMLVILALGVVFYFFGFTEYLSNSYAGQDSGDATTDGIYYLLVLFFLIAAASSILFFRIYRRVPALMVVFFIVCSIYCLILLISGDRNNFFLIVTTLGAGYYTYVKSITRLRIVLYVLAALFLYQVIEVSRQADKRSVGAIFDALTSQSANVSTDLDKGSFSITTIATRFAFSAVPDKHDFFYGKFKLIGLGGVIPYSRALYVSKNDHFTTSSAFLENRLGTTYSMGTSIIADSYLDFGIPGVIGLMFLLGAIGRFIQNKAAENLGSVKWGAVYLITLSTYAEVSRYSFDFIVRNMAWSIFIFSLFEFFAKKQSAPPDVAVPLNSKVSFT